MKKEMNISLGRSKNGFAFFGPIIASILSCITLNSPAAVQATRFDPPLVINAWADPPVDGFYNVLAADFNADGEADFRLAYGMGAMEAFFNAPTRFAGRMPQPNYVGGGFVLANGGPVGAVPLNSIIGTNIVARGTNLFAWWPGYTNNYDLTQPLGDHEATVIIANVVPTMMPGPIISISTNGTPVTNIFWPLPTVTGDVANREAVMAVEFNVSGERHYGYIHFDFRAGAGGVIYGWAYETAPNVAIKAVPLSNSLPRTHKRFPIRVEPANKARLESGDKSD